MISDIYQTFLHANCTPSLIRQPFGLPPSPRGKALVRCKLAMLSNNLLFNFLKTD